MKPTREEVLHQAEMALRNLLWACCELDKKNRVRQFDEFVDNAKHTLIALLQAQAAKPDSDHLDKPTETSTDTSLQAGYWCVICARYLPADEQGVVIHDNLPHLNNMTFDDDTRPQ